MGKLYWRNSIVGTDTASYINFSPVVNSGVTSTNVNSAINEVAKSKTGLIMTQQVSAGTTSNPDVTVSFTNLQYFTDSMYVDPYTSTGINYDEVTYDSATKTIKYKFKNLKQGFTMRIVVKF